MKFKKTIVSTETIRKNTVGTGKYLLQAFTFTSTNPQYDKRLFIDLPVQYMKTTSSEHVVYTSCYLF